MCVCVCVSHFLYSFIHQETDTFFKCLGSWLLWMRIHWAWECRYLWDDDIIFFRYIYSKEQWPNNVVVLFLMFWGASIPFLTVLAPIFTLTESIKLFPFQCIIIIYSFFHNGYCKKYGVVSSCGFDLHFSDD